MQIMMVLVYFEEVLLLSVRHEKVLGQQQLLAEISTGNMGKTIIDRILISLCGTRTLHI